MADRRNARPKVWLLADRRGRAYDQLCHGVAAALDEHYEFRIAYVQEQPDLSQWDFDLVMVCFWGETWHQQFVAAPRRVLKLLCSHRWQEEGFGHLDPAAFAAKHLEDAGTLGATSLRLAELVGTERPVLHTPEGVDTDRFIIAAESKLDRRRDKEVSFGFVGNASDPRKGVEDLLRPAAEGFDLRIAGGDHGAAEIDRFYTDLDVVVVSSSREGQPRPLLEGMASGCFLISTDVGIAPELIRHGDNGLIVERSQEALRAAMHWCRSNPETVRRAGSRNRAEAQATRTWDAMASHWRELFAAAMARLPKAAPTAAQHTGAIDRARQDYQVQLDAVHMDGPDENAMLAASAYYRRELLPVLPDDRDAKVLDVGCAHGLLLEFLHGQGYRDLQGVEIAPGLHARAAARLGNRAQIHLGDALAWLGQHPEEFDVITAYDILELFPLEDAVAFAEAIRKALRPGGVALFRTPNMANVLGIYSRYMDLTHQVGLTEQSAAQLMRLAGFDSSELCVPDFSAEPSLAAATAESRAFHERLFALQDRSMPRCFDKNIVMAARVHAPVVTPTAEKTEVRS